jgi:hypothetical protein
MARENINLKNKYKQFYCGFFSKQGIMLISKGRIVQSFAIEDFPN